MLEFGRIWTRRPTFSRSGGVAQTPRRRLSSYAIAMFMLLLVTPLVRAGEPTRETVRSELLDRINRDRDRHGLAPVDLDPLASQIADAYCGAQVETGTRGHFSTDGLAPYMRYSFAGIHDAVLENAASWSARESVPEDMISGLAHRSHSAMIAEIPPDDGHRLAILDPHITHVGIGVSWGGREVRIIEALLRRYLTWESKSQNLSAGETSRFEARILESALIIDSVTVHFESIPYRLTRERANSIDNYGLPPEWIRLDRASLISPLDAAVRPRSRSATFDVTGNRLTFDLAFNNGRGIYTLVVWVRRPGAVEPFAATNLSVIVEASGNRHAISSRGSGGGSASELRHD